MEKSIRITKTFMAAMCTVLLAILFCVPAIFVASAQTEFSATDLFTVSGATISVENNLGTAQHKGVYINSPGMASDGDNTWRVKYTGNINGVFNGNTRINYVFPGAKNSDGSCKGGNVILKIADVLNPTNYFEIEFFNIAWGGWYTSAAIVYNGNYRRTGNSKDAGGKYLIIGEKVTDKDNDGGVILYPEFGGQDGASGYIQLCMEGDVLCVYAPKKGNEGVSENWLIAKFDGSTEIDQANQKFGLPKISFKNGYTVSFTSNYTQWIEAMPVCFESIETGGTMAADGTLTGATKTTLDETLTAEPSWYTLLGTVKAHDVLPGYVKKNEALDLTLDCTVTRGSETAAEKATILEVKTPSADFAPVADPTAFTPTELGEYSVRYIGSSGVDYFVSAIEQTFIVCDELTDTAPFINVSGGTVTSGKNNSGNFTHLGLTVTPNEEAAYEGKIKGLFTGNTRINFMFPGKKTLDGDGYRFDGRFNIRIADAANPEKYFDVEYYTTDWGFWYTGIAVKYNGEYRTTDFRKTDSKYAILDAKKNDSSEAKFPIFYPEFNGSDTEHGGYLDLSWNSNILTVSAPNGSDDNNNEQWTIACFDGSNVIDQDSQKFGLPEMTFEKGFTVSFSSNVDGKVSPVCFTSIVTGGVTTDTQWEKTPAPLPSWYTDYGKLIKITQTQKLDVVPVGEKIYPAATFVRLADDNAANQAVGKIEVKGDGDWASVPASGYLIEKAGNYTLRYTAIAGDDTLIGNVLEVPFKASAETLHSSKLISLDGSGAIVTAAKDNSGSEKHIGLTVEPVPHNGYSGAFSGVFSGNTTINFSFPGTAESDGACPRGQFKFKFADAQNPDKYFEVEYFNCGWGHWFTSAAVIYNDGYRATKHFLREDGGYHIVDFKNVDPENKEGALRTSTVFGGSNGMGGYIKLTVEDEILTVSISKHLDNAYAEWVLAKFDGTEHVDSEKQQFGLPLMKFEHGYTVSFSSSADLNAETPVCFESINGVALDKTYLLTEGMKTVKSFELLGEATEQVDATRDPLMWGDPDLAKIGAKATYTVDFGTEQSRFAFAGEDFVYPAELPDFTVIGTLPEYTYTYADRTLTQTVTIVATPPVVRRVDGEEGTVFALTDTNKTMSVAASDVVAKDKLGDVDNIKIYVSKDGGERAEVAGDKVSFDGLGVYAVIYVATNDAGLSGECTYTVTVKDGNVPVISVDPAITLPEKATTGGSIKLPAATATDGGQAVSVTRNVYFNGTLIELTGDTLNLDKAGTYEIVYFAVDADGHEDRKSFTITVEQKPTEGEEWTPPDLTVPSGDDNGVNVGAIVGGVLGGVALAAAAAVVAVLVIKKKKAGASKKSAPDKDSIKPENDNGESKSETDNNNGESENDGE